MEEYDVAETTDDYINSNIYSAGIFDRISWPLFQVQTIKSQAGQQ